MNLFIIFAIGLLIGEVLLAYWTISAVKREEKNHDRDYQDTQSNKERDSGFYPVSSERRTESSVPGSSCNGKSLDITKELTLYSRNVLAQYCNSQSRCEECWLKQNGGCSLISGPPCMWGKKEGEEDV